MTNAVVGYGPQMATYTQTTSGCLRTALRSTKLVKHTHRDDEIPIWKKESVTRQSVTHLRCRAAFGTFSPRLSTFTCSTGKQQWNLALVYCIKKIMGPWLEDTMCADYGIGSGTAVRPSMQ